MKMKQKSSRRSIWGKIILIFLFLLALITFRLLWVHMFDGETELTMTYGGLDSRGLDFSNNDPITLTGAWDSCRHVLLEVPLEEIVDQPPGTIAVPSVASELFNSIDHCPYGYGAYHLRISVEPDEDISFS